MRSEANREALARGMGKYVLAVPMGAIAEVKTEVLSRPGRYRQIEDHLFAKECAPSDTVSYGEVGDGAAHLRALFARYLKVKGGEVCLDAEAIHQAPRLDGKWVLITNDDTLSVEDAAVAYKSLLVIERCFRSLKRGQIQLAPMYHRLSQRIEAHVKICVAFASHPAGGGAYHGGLLVSAAP